MGISERRRSPASASSPTRRLGGWGAALAIVLALAYYLEWAIIAPWDYYWGGHFHWQRGWHGVGRLQAPAAGGEYTLGIRILPTSGRRHVYVSGEAMLCTPRGERLPLAFTVRMPAHAGAAMSGRPLRLLFLPSHLASDRRHPQFHLYGAFDGEQLQMHDRGELAAAFTPQGLLREQPTVADEQNDTQVRFHPSDSWSVSQRCGGGGAFTRVSR